MAYQGSVLLVMRTVGDLLARLRVGTIDDADLSRELGVRIERIRNVMKELANAGLIKMERVNGAGWIWARREHRDVTNVARQRGLLSIPLPPYSQPPYGKVYRRSVPPK